MDGVRISPEYPCSNITALGSELQCRSEPGSEGFEVRLSLVFDSPSHMEFRTQGGQQVLFRADADTGVQLITAMQHVVGVYVSMRLG